MTICNRSNDVIWGMLGANVVHMSYLFELVSHGTEFDMGMYQVFSNNAHIYKNLPKYDEIINTRAPVDYYTEKSVNPMPLLGKNEGVGDFLLDAYELVLDATKPMRTKWMTTVAKPMMRAWFEHRAKNTKGAIEITKMIEAEDWSLACLEWLQRRVA